MIEYRLCALQRNAQIMCAFGIVFSAACMEPSVSLIARLGREVCNAALAGTLDVMLSEPLEYFKTMRQVGMKPSGNPRAWYRGAPVSLASALPTTIIQFTSRELLKDMLPGDDFDADIKRSLIGGFASSLTATPAEFLKLHLRMQQERGQKKPILETAQSLIATGGPRVLLCGITTKALREGIFSSGYLAIYPNLFAELSNAGLDGVSASLVAAAVTAACVTCVSHPFDTVSTRMQEDYMRKHARTSWQHACEIYRAEGTKGFYSGVSWRFLSVLIAVFSMGNVALYTREKESRLNC